MSWRRLRTAGVLGLNARNARLVAPLNPRDRFPAVDDKVRSKQLAIAAGIPVPALLGEVSAYGDVPGVHAKVADGRPFVVKPVQGAQGNGVLVVTGRRDGAYVRSDGSVLGAQDLEYHLDGILAGLHSLGGRPDRAMLEERLTVHPLLAPVAFEGVPDVRVIVYRGEPAMAMLRLPTQRSRGRANLHQGAVAAGIDLDGGRTTHGLFDGRACLRHPDTGQLVVDLQLPDWPRILDIARRAAVAFGLGYLGIDVVIDATHGPVLLEGNARPGLAIQLANDAGLSPRLAAIDARLDGGAPPRPSRPPPERRPSWHRAFQDATRTHGFEPAHTKGEIPQFLQGTLYRVGPGRFANFGHEYGHWFDGDGLVTAFRLGDGEVRAACRWVETPHLRREREAGRALYGNYGTFPPGPAWNRFVTGAKNAANTSTWSWNDRLFALHEPSPPVELDPETLETRGEAALHGTRPFAQSAHPRRVASLRTTFNFAVEYGLSTHVRVHAYPDGGPGHEFCRFPIAGPSMLHDFAATARALVFLVAPLRLDLFRTASRLATYSENLRWRPELGTEVVVVPLDAPDRPRRFTVEPFWSWHVANAFDDGEALVLDVVRSPGFASNDWLASLPTGRPRGRPDGTLHRLVIDPARGGFRTTAISPDPCEFPRIDPRTDGARHDAVFVAAHSARALQAGAPHDAIARLDVDSGTTDRFELPEGQWASEPVFVPDPQSPAHDGAVLVQVYDDRRHRSGLQVFDARHLAAGPVATAWLDHAVPLTFHGHFRPRS